MVPKQVTIHCSDSANGGDVDAAEIRKWHLARGWSDIGYHWVICTDGEVQNGRPLNVVGAHVEGHNEGNIGICMVGKDKFTQAQFKSLRSKLEDLRITYGIQAHDIHCHYEFDTAIRQGKTCPNMNIGRLLAWYIQKDDLIIAPYILEKNT